MNPILIVALLAIAPLFVLIAYGRWKVVKARRKEAADEAAGLPISPPFEPKPEPTPGFFLRHFSEPQRTYLRQQAAISKGAGAVYAWAFIVVFSSGLLPGYINRYGVEIPLAQRVWYSYLLHVASTGIIYGIMIVFAAVVAVSGLTTGAQAIVNRARPLPLRFLFWARILAALATILAAILIGMAVSFLLLLIFYGPVWQHLSDPPRIPMLVLSHSEIAHYLQTVETSAFRIFLALLTTATLIFSFLLAVMTQPFTSLNKRPTGVSRVGIMMIGGIFGAELYSTAVSPLFPHYARIFFVYSTLGPPPPYVFALVPIALSTALLFLAARFHSRVEI